jgi:(p)ppGpp synthase/HD superfamily hydrolase
MKTDKRYIKALAFAGRAHRGQKRKYRGEPYITHPMAVADMLITLVPDHTMEMVQAALLHDVVEDTPITIEQIQAEFGDTVSRYVTYLTDVSVPSDGNRKVRKRMDAEWNALGPAEAQTIKVADLIHNSLDIREQDPKFWKLYKEEKMFTLRQLHLADPDLKALARKLIEESL